MAEVNPPLQSQQFELTDAPGGDLPVMVVEDLGESSTDGTLTTSGVRLILGTRPLAYDLRALRRQAGLDDPEQKLYRVLHPWLIVHHIGVICELNARPVRALRYEADFGSELVTTMGLSPDLVTQSSKLGTMSFSSTIDANGSVRVGGEQSAVGRVLPLGGGLKLGMDSSLTIEGNIDLCKRVVPRVHSAGLGAARAEWYFRADDEPLAGSQTMAQVLLAPKNAHAVSFRVRGELVLGSVFPGLVASKHTPWVDVTCNLVRG